jgi:hypothetical protein
VLGLDLSQMTLSVAISIISSSTKKRAGFKLADLSPVGVASAIAVPALFVTAKVGGGDRPTGRLAD